MTFEKKVNLFLAFIFFLLWSFILYGIGNKSGIREGILQANDVVDRATLELTQSRQFCCFENVELRKRIDELNEANSKLPTIDMADAVMCQPLANMALDFENGWLRRENESLKHSYVALSQDTARLQYLAQTCEAELDTIKSDEEEE